MALYRASTTFDWAGWRIDVGQIIEDDHVLYTLFPDRFITTERAALRAVKTDAGSFTTTSLTTITGLSLTATPDGGAYDLFLRGPLVLSCTDLMTCRLCVLEDGVIIFDDAYSFPHFGTALGAAEGMALRFSFATLYTPTAAQHTWTVQGQITAGAGTNILNGGVTKPWELGLTPVGGL